MPWYRRDCFNRKGNIYQLIFKAKIFKEEYNKINSKKYPDVLNLYSMRLGVTTVIALAN